MGLKLKWKLFPASCIYFTSCTHVEMNSLENLASPEWCICIWCFAQLLADTGIHHCGACVDHSRALLTTRFGYAQSQSFLQHPGTHLLRAHILVRVKQVDTDDWSISVDSDSLFLENSRSCFWEGLITTEILVGGLTNMILFDSFLREKCTNMLLLPFSSLVKPHWFAGHSLNRICLNLRCSTEKAMAPHSSTLAWKIPWTEDPGGL